MNNISIKYESIQWTEKDKKHFVEVQHKVDSLYKLLGPKRFHTLYMKLRDIHYQQITNIKNL